MICLTGDIHHLLPTPGQKMYEESEAELGLKYLEIAEKYNIKVTFFITGKAFIEDWDDVKKLLKYNNLEIGGHTWDAFQNKSRHRLFKLFSSSSYGPAWFQEKDVKKTLDIIKARTGQRVVSWRTHAYNSNSSTKKILKKFNIRIMSDKVDATRISPTRDRNIILLPINVMPDHEHVLYGPPERIEKQKRGIVKDSFGKKAYDIVEYGELVKKRIKFIESKKGIATLLLHPQCMKLADNFKTFEEICKFMAREKFQTIFCKEVE